MARRSGADVLSAVRYFIDGQQVGAQLTAGGGTSSSIDAGSWTSIGYAGSGSSALGDVAEVLVYDRLLSELERRQLEAALGVKYGLGIWSKEFFPPAAYDSNTVAMDAALGLVRISEQREHLFRSNVNTHFGPR